MFKLAAVLHSTVAQSLILSGLFSIGLAKRPSPPSKSFIIPAMLAVYLYILFKPSHETTGDITYQIAFAGAVQMVQAVDYLLIHDAQHTLHQKNVDPSKPPIFSQSFFSRLLWSFVLMVNWRGSNWNFEAPNLRHSSLKRSSFAASRLLWWFLLVVVADVLYIYAQNNPILRGDEPFGTHGYAWQAWNVMLYWTALYCFQQSSHSLGAAICVGLGFSVPDDWPSYHGYLSDTVSTRKFWGRFWQQGLRRPLSTAGKYIANTMLKYPKGSFMSRYIQLYVAFALSGLFHAFADWAITKDRSAFQAIMTYYVLQAMIITLEDGLVGMAKIWKIPTDNFPRALLYAWVFAWQVITSPMWFETMVRHLPFEPPFSTVKYLLST